ncbi:hypothetical protein [Rhizobium sp. Root1203]|uniref:hypothetical protein n=1 Tax=Rhizobium sp. Root1203 TaxID=1736427 RepID=UPI000ABE4E35|nr:hypothetical protein [Rhizobium sp. Root1203]
MTEAKHNPEPFAWVPKRQWDRITSGDPWLTVTVYSEDQEACAGGVPLYVSPQPSTLPAPDFPKYINLINGDICELVSQGPDGVTLRREGSTKLAYLGLSEFEKRFDLITPPPSTHVVVFTPAEIEEAAAHLDLLAEEYAVRATDPRCNRNHYLRASAKAKQEAADLRSRALPVPAQSLVGYQERVAMAHHALFHDDPTDVAERLARFFEEVNETCQALGMSREDAHKLVDYTYDRPTGDPRKEIGAAMLTLTSLCVVAGIDLMNCAEADLEKLQRPETIARIRAKRATRHGRGPLPGLDPATASEVSIDGN